MLAISCAYRRAGRDRRQSHALDAAWVASVGRSSEHTLARRIAKRVQWLTARPREGAKVVARYTYEGLRGIKSHSLNLSIHEITLATHARDYVSNRNIREIWPARVLKNARAKLATLAAGEGAGERTSGTAARLAGQRATPLGKGPFLNPTRKTGRKLPALGQCPTVQAVHGMHACTRAARNVFPRSLQS